MKGHKFYGNQYIKINTTTSGKRMRGPTPTQIINKMSEPMSDRAAMIASMSNAEYSAFKKKLGIKD
jgi:hypothetical protein